MAEHKLFLIPTLGENFGHVIFESLAVGCPVLISDRTPWRGLEEKGVGWDVPLGDVARFRAILQECVDMDSEAYASLSQRARGYAVQYEQDSSVLDTYRVMFDCRGSAPKISHGR
jgi:glycosyltransferase involved in cell wall biosynthesis